MRNEDLRMSESKFQYGSLLIYCAEVKGSAYKTNNKTVFILQMKVVLIFSRLLFIMRQLFRVKALKIRIQ